MADSMGMAVDPPKPLNVTVSWEGAEDFPVAPCNLFVSQFTHAEFTVTFGYASPVLAAPKDAAKLSVVKSKAVARLSLSPQRMQELIDVLKQSMEQFQQAQIAARTVGEVKH